MFRAFQSELGINQRLYEKPEKITGENAPKITVEKPRIVIQVDLLFLPNDRGYRYALVAVDLNTRKTDAEPIKNKQPKEVVEAIKKIFNRGIVQKPQYRVESDAGTEFKGAFKKYLDDSNIRIRYGKPGRSKQQGVVEAKNKTIGKAIMMYQTSLEQVHGERKTDWVDILPKIIKIMNEHSKAPKLKLDDKIRCSGNSCNLLEVGTEVRVKLDKPSDFLTGKRDVGNFRAGDIRWKPEVVKIKEILMKPNQPPMYLVEGNTGTAKVEPVAYTREELQVVKDKWDVEPDAEKMGLDAKDTTKQYQVKEIVEKKKENNRIYYKVRWVGFNSQHDTWELKTNLPKGKIEEFEKKNNG